MIRVGSRVYHKFFGAGNVTAIYDGYLVVKFDKTGKRAVAESTLSERPFEKPVPTYKKSHGPFYDGQVVYHRIFGKGIIKDIRENFAIVKFDGYDERIMNYDSLSLKFITPKIDSVKSIREINGDKIKVSNLDIIECVIDCMRNQHINSMLFDDCVNIVRNKINTSLQTVFIKNSLDPSSNKVYLVHILKKQSKIYKKYLSEIFVTLDKVMQTKSPEPLNNGTEDSLSDFERATLKEPFTSSIKMYFARAIIRFCLETLVTDDTYYSFMLDDLAKRIMVDFLYQASVGILYNQLSEPRQPHFYYLVESCTYDNAFTSEESKNLTKEIKKELEFYFIRTFTLTNLENIYFIYDDRIVFTKNFVKKMKEEGKNLDNRVVNRLCYFLDKINNHSDLVKAYSNNIKHGLDRKNFVLKFDFQSNLQELASQLDKDIYLKSEFKALMKKYGIPSNDTYLGMCLDRIDYSLKTKRIILNSRYPNLKAYYKEEILKNDIYRYSNPLNLDEYDVALKSLQNDLILIEVGNGVYLTRKNMEKNGINDNVITSFQEEIERIGYELKFFSLKDVEERLQGNPIVEYCDGDKKQLVQFIKPVPNIKVIVVGKKGIIISFTNSKKYRGELIEFIMKDKNEMDIYEIKDFAEKLFDVEYSLDEIIKDVSQTTFYYSEDMEKVYRHKEQYIKEVFYDGN